MLKEKILRLKEKCYSCTNYSLGRKTVDGLDPHVFGSGNVVADIMFVGEAPGSQEVIDKRPLVGRAGQFYNEKILKIAGLERKEVYITNAAMCRPNEKNRNPLLAELEACLYLLDAQIVLVDPKLIVTFGNIPLYSVCDIPPAGITKRRGQFTHSRKWSNGKEYLVFPMLHPSYCLRGSGLKEMQTDALKLGEIALSIKNRGEINES